jgi:alkanesulfonate monooxygenase SsuD/methylene tetrahydromethanopterin reductase-like flavin-dependent oxidoreductase (luciferase family)
MLAPFFQSRERLKTNVQLYKDTLHESGFSPDSVDIVAGYHTFVDETPALARHKWEDHYMRYLHFVGGLVNPAEYSDKQYGSWRKSTAALQQVSFEQMYPDQVLCGDPSQCVERVALLAEEYGVTHFWVYMDLGGLAQREVLGSMERFATRVMPKFR